MIKIKRPARPAKLAASSSKTAYNSPEVRKVLWEMQHEKCCYCEIGRLPQKGTGAAVEHFWPKGSYPRKTNVWRNLLLICDPCNGRKLEEFPLDSHGFPLLIDPTSPELDPEVHLKFEVKLDTPECGEVTGSTPRGEETVRVIGLDTRACTLERLDAIYQCSVGIADLQIWQRKLELKSPGAQAQVKIAEEKLIEKAKNYSPYAATVRKIYRDLGFERLINTH